MATRKLVRDILVAKQPVYRHVLSYRQVSIYLKFDEFKFLIFY